jgi:hypothetical protein
MNPPTRFSHLFAICLLFVLTFTGYAQETSVDKTESLRLKIVELESTDLKSKSSIVQDLYKRTLLRLYEEYAAALRLDIGDLNRIQETIKNTAADPQREVEARLNKLTTELGVTEEKLKTLAGEGVLPSVTATTSVTPAPTPTGDLPRPTIIAPVTAPTTLSVASIPVSAAPPVSNDAEKFKVCGQLRPALLTSIFAFIESAQGLETLRDKAHLPGVTNSRLTGKCDEDADIKVGDQRNAVVSVLKGLLNELEGRDSEGNPKTEARKSSYGLPAPSTETIKKQILTLNEYIGNAIVKFEGPNDALFTALTDKDGNYSIEVPEGIYFVSTEVDDGRTRRQVHITGQERVNILLEDRPVSLLSRAVVGYEQAGASSTKRSQDYFFDLFVSNTLPFKQKIDPNFGERVRAWTDFRFSSVPQSGDATIGDFSTGFATQVSGLKVKDVANVFDFMSGIEIRLTGNSALLPSFDRRTKQKFSLSFIAGGGVITPTNSLDSLTVFKVSPDAIGLPPEAAGKEFVAFIQLDRDRFFRQYYAGVRLQTYFFNLFNMPMQRFPAQFDLTIGQNEFVTGGKLKGPVFRIEGYYPLPFEEMKFINIFGSAVLRFGAATTGTPLVLIAAPDGTPVPAPNVALIALPQPNRDYYRVGFGLDFISFVEKMRDALSKK